MILSVEKDEKAFDLAAAWRIVAQMVSKPDSVIGLSTGRTTGNMHRIAAEIYRAHPFDVSGITILGQDEVVNVPREYSGSCWTMLKTEIVDTIGLPESNFLMLPVSSDDYGRDCKAFTDEIDARGGIDLLILGIGENGHLGFNQPGTPFGSGCRVSYMMPELESRLRRESGVGDDVVLAGVTLGLKDIMKARKIILVAKGKSKADIIGKAVCGPVTEDVPASILQLHNDCEVLLDTDAAEFVNRH